MKAIKIDLPRDLKSIELHIFSDLHIGDKNCDKEKIKEHIEYVKNKENAFAVLNGDIINNATKTSVSDCYAEEISPMEQLSTFVELFEPIKDKILSIVTGNHENRTYIKEGVDITFLCACQLGLADRYSKAGNLLFVRFGELSRRETGNASERRRVCYTVYQQHGTGGGRKEGGKINRLADMASIVDADIYIMGHTHLPVVMKESYYRTDAKNSTFRKVDKLFVNASASLDFGGYGEQFQFKPASKECPVIYLSGTKKEFTAKL